MYVPSNATPAGYTKAKSAFTDFTNGERDCLKRIIQRI
jgi:hypothetical protein